jgi:hypothetical protein
MYQVGESRKWILVLYARSHAKFQAPYMEILVKVVKNDITPFSDLEVMIYVGEIWQFYEGSW